MDAPIIGTIEVPRLPDLTDAVARRGRALLGAARDGYLASLGVVAVAHAESARAASRVAARARATYGTLIERGEALDRTRAEKVAGLRAGAAARREAVVATLDAKVARPVRDASSALVRRSGLPTRDEVRALATSVAALSRTVDALLAQSGAPAVAATPSTITVAATDDGWAVRLAGAADVLATHATREGAVDAARALAAERAPSHLVVYENDGTVQDTVSYHA